MPLYYVYIDGLWVQCDSQIATMAVVEQGGRQEPYGFEPESGSLIMRFNVWLRNLTRANSRR